MDIAVNMAADIALAIDGGDWQDAKWFSKFHREAWIKAVQPYADEIERLREELKQRDADIERLRGEVMAWWKETEIMRSDLAIYSEQIERLQEILKMWVKFWNEDGDDVWAAEEAMAATNETLKGIK